MNLFNRKVCIALDVLQYLYKVDEMTTTEIIAEVLDEPLPYLYQILYELNKKGYIISSKGRSGGVYLSQKYKTNTISDLLNDLDHTIDPGLVRPIMRLSEYIGIKFSDLAHSLTIEQCLVNTTPIDTNTSRVSGAV